MNILASETNVGRELQLSELRDSMTVVVRTPGRNLPIRIVINQVNRAIVDFYCQAFHLHIVNFVWPDGTLRDIDGNVVQVFAYTGKVPDETTQVGDC
jgi:hypothetical protein